MSRDDAGGSPLWAGRFSEPPAPEAAALGRSLHVDARLAQQDVEAGVAHVRALQDAGLLTPAEAGALEEALAQVGEDLDRGRVRFEPADEDIHSVVERAVTERLGDARARSSTPAARGTTSW